MKDSTTHSFRFFTYKLKTLLIVAIVFMISSSSEAAVAPGLFQRLIKIKYSSELYLITKAKESNRLNRPETLDSALAVYNTIRWNLDGLVYQLSGDLVAANSPKKYKQINQWCLNSKAAGAKRVAANNLNGALLSACASHELSADAYIENRFNGAFTHYLLKNLKKYAAKMPMNKIIQLVDKDLAANDYDQRPQTEGLLEDKLFFL
jgi:hypothetical protein